MPKKHQIFRYILVSACLTAFGFVGQLLFAQMDTELQLENITIDTTTGRYVWPEIQPLGNTIGNTAPDIDVLMYIPNENILNVLNNADTYQDAASDIRLLVLQQMMSNGFSGFISTPLPDANDKFSLLTNTGFVDFVLLEDIPNVDSLDTLIMNKIVQYRNQISQNLSPRGLDITQSEYDSLHDIYLFKSNEDLYKLGYEIVSYRYRTNEDAAYRRHNISLAFSRLGNIRVINPGETFAFLESVKASSEGRFMAGPSIVGGKIVYLYGGGLCGASTAFYQGILTNTAAEIVERSPHTKRYANLYDSFINGESINTPGLDSTIFSDTKDIRITNTRDYPLIIVMNYDGSEGGFESAFSLAKSSDKGSLVYKGKGQGKCYTREINGTDVSSCYQQVH